MPRTLAATLLVPSLSHQTNVRMASDCGLLVEGGGTGLLVEGGGTVAGEALLQAL